MKRVLQLSVHSAHGMSARSVVRCWRAVIYLRRTRGSWRRAWRRGMSPISGTELFRRRETSCPYHGSPRVPGAMSAKELLKQKVARRSVRCPHAPSEPSVSGSPILLPTRALPTITSIHHYPLQIYSSHTGINHSRTSRGHEPQTYPDCHLPQPSSKHSPRTWQSEALLWVRAVLEEARHPEEHCVRRGSPPMHGTACGACLGPVQRVLIRGRDQCAGWGGGTALWVR